MPSDWLMDASSAVPPSPTKLAARRRFDAYTPGRYRRLPKGCRRESSVPIVFLNRVYIGSLKLVVFRLEKLSPAPMSSTCVPYPGCYG